MSAFLVSLSWKNLWRTPRRTLITAGAIAFGVTALVSLHNYYDAFHEQLVANAIRFHCGHLLVTDPDFHESKAPARHLKYAAKVERWLARRPDVRASSAYVLLQALLSSPRGSANIWIKGIDSARESAVTGFASRMVHGSFLEAGGAGKHIVLGSKLAELLKVDVGGKLVALTQGVDGSIGNELFLVAGIFETRSELDKSLAFVRIDDARRLLSLPADAVHQISVVMKSEQELMPLLADFRSANRLPGVAMMSWKEVQESLMAVIELNRSANRLLMGIILLIAGMGIVNSILMSLMERRREFGVMMAVGTTRREMLGMVVTETFLLGLVGAAIGNLLGVLVTIYFGRYGFDLKWLTSQELVINGSIIQTVSYPSVNPRNNLVVTGFILAITLLVGIIPMRCISKLSAVKALASR